MAKYAREEAEAQNATSAMADSIAKRKRELAEKKAKEEEEAMARCAHDSFLLVFFSLHFSLCFPFFFFFFFLLFLFEFAFLRYFLWIFCAPFLFRRYAQEEAQAEMAKASMADRIAARKKELAEKKALEEEAQMKAYAQAQMTEEDRKKAVEARVQEMKEKLAAEKERHEAELKQKMLEMKKAGKSVEEIKAFVLAEKKKAAGMSLK
jgi:hypothetical protein